MRSVIKLSLFSYLLLIVFTLCIVVYPCASIASERFPSFTSSEKQWIQKNPIVKFSIHEKYRHYYMNYGGTHVTSTNENTFNKFFETV